jgi:hypothetical protein
MKQPLYRILSHFVRLHGCWQVRVDEAGAAQCLAKIDGFVRGCIPPDNAILRQGYRFCMDRSEPERLVFVHKDHSYHQVVVKPSLASEVLIELRGPIVDGAHGDIPQLKEVLCTLQEEIII